VRQAVRMLDGDRPVAFTINGTVTGDPWRSVLVAYNGEPTPCTLRLPPGEWSVVADATRAGTRTLGTASGQVTLPPYSMLVAHGP